MKNSARSNVLGIKPYVPGKPIEEVKRELGLAEVYKLASNENPYPPSPKVLKALVKAAQEINRYPDGSCYELRRAVAKHLGVEGRQIVFANGSDELIVLAIHAFANEGDEVVIARPTFLVYEIASRVAGAKITVVPMKDFRYDLVAMKKVVTEKTKIVFIANPDNPVGTYVTKEEMEKFLDGLNPNVLVFLDEAYCDYAPKKDYPDSLSLIQRYPNVVFARTFSKSYGLAGLRVGYGVSSPDVIDILNRVREPFNVNSLAQVAAIAALKDQAYYRKAIKIVLKEKTRLFAALKAFKVSCVPSATNFILINVGRNSCEVAQALLRKGVIVRDMGAWGLDTFIRVTVGKPNENNKFLTALKEIL